MIPKDVIEKIKRIRIKTKRLVNEVFAGEYSSAFKGHGMEFHEVREYQPGDDIKSIDWNVTARTGKPFVKRFIEERELSIFFMVDLSGSSFFGTRSKAELAAEICTLLSFSAVKNNDRIGLILFTEKPELFIPEEKGIRHALRITREILCFKPESKGTSIKAALDFAGNVIPRNSVVFLLSDFFDSDFEKSLKTASKRFDLVSIVLNHPAEIEIPDSGIIELRDDETGNTVQLDSSSKKIRREIKSEYNKMLLKLKKNFQGSKIDFVNIITNEDYGRKLALLFLRREMYLR